MRGIYRSAVTPLNNQNRLISQK